MNQAERQTEQPIPLSALGFMLFKTEMAGINAYRDVVGGRIHELVQ